MLCSNLFLNKVGIAPFSIASLFAFFKEDLKSMKLDENPFKFRGYAKIMGYLSLFRNVIDEIAWQRTGHFATLTPADWCP